MKIKHLALAIFTFTAPLTLLGSGQLKDENKFTPQKITRKLTPYNGIVVENLENIKGAQQPVIAHTPPKQDTFLVKLLARFLDCCCSTQTLD
jgi:hypothetical protein